MLGCRPFTDEEVQQLVSSLKNERDKCLFILGIRTGFRISELLSIKVGDVYKDGKVLSSVYVARRNMKGQKAGRSLPLHQDAKDAIAKHIQANNPREYLFDNGRGDALKRCHAWRIIKGAADAVGLEGKIATHSLRKSYAKRVHEALGKDITKTQIAMGHANLNNTVKYLSFDQDEINQAILGA